MFPFLCIFTVTIRVISIVKIIFSLFNFQISIGSLLPKAGLVNLFPATHEADVHVCQWVTVLHNSLDVCHSPTLLSPHEETHRKTGRDEIFIYLSNFKIFSD